MRPARLITPCLMLLLLGAEKPPAPAVDDDVDFLLKKSTAPATSKASTKPAVSPFKPAEDDGRRAATLTTSDGEKYKGRWSTTLERPLRVWDESKKEYHDVPFNLIKSIQSKIVWERDEPEWHFKESGSDIKEYTGKSYPAREMEYTLTLSNGQTVTGSVAAPLFLQQSNGDRTFILHKRDKGEVGQKLPMPVYVKRMEFED